MDKPDYKSNISVSLSYYDRGLLEGIARSLRVIEEDITEHLRPKEGNVVVEGFVGEENL